MKKDFGETTKGEASLYELENQNGMQVWVTDFGATLVSILVPDRNGDLVDVTCGYTDAAAYEDGDMAFGATVGRVSNRIKGASFTLNGKSYNLTANEYGNCLHGGRDLTFKRMWETVEADEEHVTFLLHSPDGDQGFPGAVDLTVTYTLTEDNALEIHYHGVPTEDTILNFTNHSYFNLSGEDSGTVLEQEAWIDAQDYTEADEENIPTGVLTSVDGTPMDFREWKRIGEDIDADYEPLKIMNGYDHNFALNDTGMREVAGMRSGQTGIFMEVYTDLPGLQFFTANSAGEGPGKSGEPYPLHCGACFETQYFPDAIHHEEFLSPVVAAGAPYDTTTVYRFSVFS